MRPSRRAFLIATSAAVCAASAPSARPTGPFFDLPYAAWTDDDPPYRLYPGDQIDLTVLSAPELSKSLTLAPDGRVDAPLVGAIMAADLSTEALARKLEQAYASVLLRPEVEVTVRQAAQVKVFVGGEVTTPGVYELVGDMDALQAIMAAGGFKPTGRPAKVVILRRSTDGRAMMRVVDLSRALRTPQAERVPLRRFDIVFVPKSAPAEIAAYVGVITSALPLSFSYAAFPTTTK
jgi:protein involved in polysaccharide export with SLBB domain